jgi:putative radical SAM enzyme (TIGR03279 family)
MIEIKAVTPGSTGAELELEPGDRLLTLNGEPLRDLIDYQIQVAGEEILLEVEKKNGELWDLEIEKDTDDTLGLHFEHPEPTQCGNNCLFCFVHQLPRGLRPTLYLKDEDYRFSFLYGSYVTLTNVDEEVLQRIIGQHLSPLYVSVHATEEALRTRMLGRRGPPILEMLRRLTAAGIEIHTQVVLCPGINDGAELTRTIEDLYSLYPGVQSLAVVPVGLTGYRQRLPELRPLSAAEAATVIAQVQDFQQRFLEKSGSRFVFAADELYLQGGIEFPPLEAYEELPQMENGVGMVAVFRREAVEVLAEAEPLAIPPVAVVTGMSALAEVNRFAADLAAKTGARIIVHPIRSDFFGGHVSVTGLLAGKDILAQLRGKDLGKMLLIPDVMLKEGEEVFLDDLSLDDLERELKIPVRQTGSTPWGFLESLEELAAEGPQGD